MILITGITGHSGKYFLKELIKNKYEGPIRVIIRSTSDTKLLDTSGLNIEKYVGELTDVDFINSAMKDVVEVIHIASISYSTVVIKAAVKNNVKRAIFVHTTGIYSNFKSASEEYKNIEQNISEIIVSNNSDIDLIYLRPTMIYGYLNDRNMIIFIKMVDKLRLFPIVSNGNNLMQPVNGMDLGKAYYQILMKKNISEGDYILSGDKPITMKDMFNLISKVLKKKTFYLSVPLKIGVLFAQILKLITFGKKDYVEKVQRMGEDRSFPHDAAKIDFDYSPMPFINGLKLEIDEYLKFKTSNQEIIKWIY